MQEKYENEFDLNFYMAMNNDVAIRFNFNYEKIKEHFFKIGYKEQRLYSKIESTLYYFNDWIKYLNINNDIVKQKINNEILAFKHYLEHGLNEKRDIYPKKINKYELIKLPIQSSYEIIDIEFTKKINQELIDFNDNDIIKYIDENFRNNPILYSLNHRNLFENYDWNQYLIDYPDLKINKIFSKVDAIHHYLKFGVKEGRNVKLLNHVNSESNIINDNMINETKKSKDTTINFINKINENDENLLNIFKNNIIENTNNLDISKYNIKDFSEINKIYESLCLDFEYKYYYKLNNSYYNLKNNEEFCLEHFFEKGSKDFIPYSKNHYILYINYDWIQYGKDNKLEKDKEYESYLHYIKNKYYYNKNIDLPNIKFPINHFINNFYNILYDQKNENFLISYKNFLKNENKEKLFPNLFNYFLYCIIDWNLFMTENDLSLKVFELINLLKKSDYDFTKYKVQFNSIINLNIPDKNNLVNLGEFNQFYYKILKYIKNNNSIKNFTEINNQFRKLLNKDLFDIPNNFQFINYIPYENNKLTFNFIIQYINKYESLYTLLLTIFYQNYNNYKIIILNKCEDLNLNEKIEKVKESLNIPNEIIILTNDFLNENLNNLEKNDENNYISFKNHIKSFDINIVIDNNHYFSNNNTLENLCNLYEKNNNCFEKIIIESNDFNNKINNSLLILNSNNLLNNFHLLFNFQNIEFPENISKYINKFIILNESNFVDINFYNSDIEFNNNININLPIFILYEDKENLKFIKNLINYNVIEIKDKQQLDNFIYYINSNNIFNYITVIFIDKILDNFECINFNQDDIEAYNLINIYNKSKKRNMKKSSKTTPNLNTYDACIINYDLRQKYIKTSKS